ncbi:DEAD/DEAH box helicase [Auraticoccus monumenti]|uniref:DEAD/DEAH box helicase domain-containing protein n=1 Tax=Auraticoccus monumenti TaxID=675864 RepID=A0A1G6RZ80_9ACTN|nr:DEAD/DEAH box helicase [Auraticoccus monumenti]SDD09982.1 DEAD/DEAH box helicase domain-containing protein [Auraticoccus monumenti]
MTITDRPHEAVLPLPVDDRPLSHVHVLAPRAPVTAEWPTWLPEAAVAALSRRGIERPWRHQVQAAESVRAGRHTLVSTGTASGKSLAYLMPLLAEALEPRRPAAGGDVAAAIRGLRRPTALYLSPTKALAHDQLRACQALGVDGWRVGALDGDSSEGERRFAREHAHLVLTNPDMLHRSVLPSHARWSRLLGSLTHVVVDESHRYRGVFGAHVSAVLRRLRRLCESHGANPVVVLASATTADPRRSTARLLGVEPEEVAVVDDDTSPRGRISITLRRPERGVDDAAATALVEHVSRGEQALAFVPSRLRCELVALSAQDRLAELGLRTAAGDGLPLVEAYRSGYLATERRSIEARLQDGSVRAVAATNALELGIDVAGLDAVVIGGYPGTMAAFWQQAGRAGRRGGDAEVTMLTRDDPLDLYLFDHPEMVFSGRVEATVLHPGNPYVLGPHLAAAAQELPLRPEDERWFGPSMAATADQLAAQGVLRRRSRGWFWTRPDRAVDSIDLRGSGGRQVEVVESATGKVVGQADPGSADASLHEGAVYLHRGEVWVVEAYDHERGECLVHVEDPPYRTQAQSVRDVGVLAEHRAARLPRAGIHFGDVEVSSQVTGYLRRDARTGTVWDSTPLDLPPRVLRTQSMWVTVDESVLDELDLSDLALAGAAHGAEHTAIGLLPAFAPCDRWDIGGLSTVLHPDTGACTIFVHDGHPGGAGFAEHAYEHVEEWLTATLSRLRECRCETGCPACVVSPKCGNQNQLLDKPAAARLLAAVLGR